MPAIFTYTEHFYNLFPYYFSLGMTADEYWNKSPYLAVCYRKADRLKIRRKNQELWLQGAYIYEVLCDVSPIFNPYAPKGTKAHPYRSMPYPLTKEEKEQMQAKEEQLRMEEDKQKMLDMIRRINKEYENREAGDK